MDEYRQKESASNMVDSAFRRQGDNAPIAKNQSNLTQSKLQKLAKDLKAGLDIFASTVKKIQNERKNLELVINNSRQEKTQSQPNRIANLALALIHFKLCGSAIKQCKISDLTELLVSYYAHRLINIDYSEEKFFGYALKATDIDFLDDTFAVLETISDRSIYQILKDRYQYQKRKPFNKGVGSYLLWRLSQIQHLTAIQQSYVKEEKKKFNVYWRTLINPETMVESRQTQFNRFYIYKAKLKFQLGQSAIQWVDDLTCVNPAEIADKQLMSIYTDLQKQNLKKLQQSPFKIEQKVWAYLKHCKNKQAVQAIYSNLPSFSIKDTQLNQLNLMLGLDEKQIQLAENNSPIERQMPIPIPFRVFERVSIVGKVKVLNIVGGGMKGFFALLLLSEMQCRVGRPVYEIFDFFAGTSIGGIICACLASKKFTARELLIKIQGKTKNQIFHNITFGKNPIGYLFRLIIKNTVYLQSSIRQACQDLIGQTLLSETAQWKDFLITSVIQQGDQFFPCFFYKLRQRKGLNQVIAQNDQLTFHVLQGFQQVKVWQILRATSAAYPILPRITINGYHFYDGGFMFNNPSLLVVRLLNLSLNDPRRIKMLTIQLSQNHLDRNFQLAQSITHQAKNLLNMTNSSLINLTSFLQKILATKSSISEYCSVRTRQILGEDNTKDFNLYCVHLREKLSKLPQLKLDHVDFATMRVYAQLAQMLINTMDKTDSFNRICLFFSAAFPRNNPDNVRNRNITRYQGNVPSYTELDNLFMNGILVSNEQQLVQKLRSFNFPQELNPEENRIELPTRLKNIPNIGKFIKEEPLAHALSIGHLPSIKYYLNRPIQINTIQFRNDWSLYHVCIANDEFLSFHVIINRLLLNKQVYPIKSQMIIDYAATNLMRKRMLLKKILQINEILGKRGDAGIFWWDKMSARAFIKHFKADKIRRYLKGLNKNLARQKSSEEAFRDQQWQIRLDD